MSILRENLHSIIDILDEDDVSALYSIVKKMSVFYDPDYIYATPEEEERIRQGRADIQNGDYITLEDYLEKRINKN